MQLRWLRNEDGYWLSRLMWFDRKLLWRVDFALETRKANRFINWRMCPSMKRDQRLRVGVCVWQEQRRFPSLRCILKSYSRRMSCLLNMSVLGLPIVQKQDHEEKKLEDCIGCINSQKSSYSHGPGRNKVTPCSLRSWNYKKRLWRD